MNIFQSSNDNICLLFLKKKKKYNNYVLLPYNYKVEFLQHIVLDNVHIINKVLQFFINWPITQSFQSLSKTF